MTAVFHFYAADITDAQLTEFEQRRKITLPADYRQFLLLINGGVPTPNTFEFKWGVADAYAHAGRFFGLNYPAAMYDLAKGWPAQARISPQFLIISMEYIGTLFNLVCIVIEGTETGYIYYLPQYPQIDLEGNPISIAYEDFETDYPLSFFVADSFTKFLDQLVEPPPGVFDEPSGHFQPIG